MSDCTSICRSGPRLPSAPGAPKPGGTSVAIEAIGGALGAASGCGVAAVAGAGRLAGADASPSAAACRTAVAMPRAVA